MRGPIDYMIVGFNSLEFDGSILDTLVDAVDSGVISVLDLAVIAKDADGAVTRIEISDLAEENMSLFISKFTPDPTSITHLDPDDYDEVAGLMEVNTAAGILVIEHLWAKPLKKALLDKNAYLVAEGRIHEAAAAEIDQGE